MEVLFSISFNIYIISPAYLNMCYITAFLFNTMMLFTDFTYESVFLMVNIKIPVLRKQADYIEVLISISSHPIIFYTLISTILLFKISS